MFSVRKPVWWQGTNEDHGQAAILADYPQNWDEARVLAGLDWEPEVAEVFADAMSDEQIKAAIADVLLAGETIKTTEQIDRLLAVVKAAYAPIKGWQNVRNDQTRETIALTHDTYAVINHTAFGDILEALLDCDRDKLKLETGGSLAGGSKVWMLVMLDEPIILPGDKSAAMPFVALTGRHDALGSVTARATAVRIVCANTFRAAEMEGERTGATFTFRHTGNWRERIDDAKEAIKGVRREIRAYVELSERLLGIKVTPEQRERFVVEFVPKPPEALLSDRVAANTEAARKAVRDILASETCDGIDLTAYGLVQAAGEYLDHVRRANSWETKLNRSLIRPESLKARATSLALAVAND
jgi:phage/plasmid-like protein (TIGR03299 family)